jgi:S-formylglutathione hydrolase FrmB
LSIRLHRLPIAVAALLAAAVVALLGAAGAAASAKDITVTDTERLSPRLLDLTMDTAALPGPVHARILLPAGYDDHPRRSYPMLFLLHGGFGAYSDWTTAGRAEDLTAPYDLITVMPEDGNGGWYSDWYNGGTGGPPMWETYDIDQLIPWVDAHFRTIGDRGGRAVAGLSTGGFGAMSLAARNPDEFSFAASFSGAVDIVGNAPVATVIGAEAVADGGDFDDPFGNREADEIVWRAHNPVDLAANLRHTELSIFYGNGDPGPLDPPGGEADAIEQQVGLMNETFRHRLDDLGVRYSSDAYGPGTHSWGYWQRDLAETLPAMMDAFATDRPDPRSFSFRSADRSFGLYGWSVRVGKGDPAIRFTRLQVTGRRGFSLRGSGRVAIRTGPVFEAGKRYLIRGHGMEPRDLRAGPGGRIALRLALGAEKSTQRLRIERRRGHRSNHRAANRRESRR